MTTQRWPVLVRCVRCGVLELDTRHMCTPETIAQLERARAERPFNAATARD